MHLHPSLSPKTVRQVTKAKDPFIGFGNPLLLAPTVTTTMGVSELQWLVYIGASRQP
jgi:hypothetical protein